MSESASHLRAVSPTEQTPSLVGSNGVRPPGRRDGPPRSLTEVIVELGLCSRERVLEAIEIAAQTGTTADRVLLERGTITPDGVALALAERYGLDHLDLSIFNVDMAAANLVTSQVAKRHEALPIAMVGERALLVAMSDPANVHAVDDIAILTGYEIRVAVTTSEDIANVIARLSRVGDVVRDGGDDESTAEDRDAAVVELHETADDAPVVRLVHQLVGQAVEQGASDLHISPDAQDLRVRFRIDGVLRDVTTVPRRLAAGVVSRMKIMAELDIAERRLPQDGRVGLTVDGHRVDLRVVTVPTVRGEGVVMRILDKQAVVDGPGRARHGPVRAEPLLPRLHAVARRRARHRSDRLRQVDDAVRRAEHGQHARSPHRHDRGSGRVSAGRDHPDPGQSAGRPDVRHRPARGRPAPGPRRDHGRRDPRPRKPPRSRSRRRSPATSCSRRCTPTMRRRRSRG